VYVTGSLADGTGVLTNRNTNFVIIQPVVKKEDHD